MSEVTRELNMDTSSMQKLFGTKDTYIRKIEDAFKVIVVNRDGKVKVMGEQSNVEKAVSLIDELTLLSDKENSLEEQKIDYAVMMKKEDLDDGLVEMSGDVICHMTDGRPVAPKTQGQRTYVKAMRDNMIVFGLGPAGTGKTFLAMAMAITAFKNNEVGRIILTRPAIEAGEKLGFLPGDLQSKVDPYLRPLYDALYQIMGAESFVKNSEKGLIEVAPLAYMRGRTLDNAYIILDEAQNTTEAQMKMFLTRIGFNSKVVITGDATQKDLPFNTVSGLDVAKRVLSKVEGISFCELTSRDVVRHPLVQKIVKAYEDYENSKNRSKETHYKTGKKRK